MSVKKKSCGKAKIKKIDKKLLKKKKMAENKIILSPNLSKNVWFLNMFFLVVKIAMRDMMTLNSLKVNMPHVKKCLTRRHLKK